MTCPTTVHKDTKKCIQKAGCLVRKKRKITVTPQSETHLTKKFLGLPFREKRYLQKDIERLKQLQYLTYSNRHIECWKILLPKGAKNNKTK